MYIEKKSAKIVDWDVEIEKETEISVEGFQPSTSLDDSDSQLGNSSDDYRFFSYLDKKKKARTPSIPKEELIILRQRNRQKAENHYWIDAKWGHFLGCDFYWKSDYQDEPTVNNVFNPETEQWEPNVSKRHPLNFEVFNPFNIKPHSDTDTFYFKIYFEVMNIHGIPWEFSQTFSGDEAYLVSEWLRKKFALGLGCKAIPVRWNNYKARFQLNQAKRPGAYRCKVHR